MAGGKAKVRGSRIGRPVAREPYIKRSVTIPKSLFLWIEEGRERGLWASDSECCRRALLLFRETLEAEERRKQAA